MKSEFSHPGVRIQKSEVNKFSLSLSPCPLPHPPPLRKKQATPAQPIANYY
ncbi:MAG TPA: hypothetical protein V6D28_16385 [Leptolyngbyaceae cyanobacterium]